MIKKVFMAMFCMILLITSSFSSFAFLDNINEDDEDNLGEVLLVNVDRYEPVTISADYIRNQNFPVYIYLSGNTLEGFVFGDQEGSEDLNTFFGDLKIKDFRIVRQSLSRYVSGVQEVPPTGGYYIGSDGDMDLGYLQLYIKKIPKEEDIPEVIDINLTARIEFDVESGFGVFGRQDLYFDGVKEKEKAIYDGRATLELLSVRGSKANFQLYDQNMNKMGGSFDLTVGGTPRLVTIDNGPAYLDNKVRLKLTALGGDTPYAIMDVSGYGTQAYVEGMNLYTGSDWEVQTIADPYVILFNSETKRKITINYAHGGEFKRFICGDYGGSLTDSEIASLFSGNLSDVQKKQDLVSNRNKVYCNAIDEYTKALEYAVGEKADELNFKLGRLYREVKDPVTALEYYSRVSSGFEFENVNVADEVKEVNEDITTGKVSSEFVDGRRVWIQSIDLPKDEDSTATITVDNSRKNVKEGDVIIQGTDGKSFEWRVVDITIGYIQITKFVDGNQDGGAVTINVGESKTFEKSKNTNVLVKVENSQAPVSAVVSVLPGDGRNYGVSHFSLHLPVEKSSIQWTPEEIDDKINSTHETIGKIDSALDKLGKFIRGLKIACYSVFSYLSVKNAFFVNNRARGEVINHYSNVVCPDLVAAKKYKTTADCLEGESSFIDAAVEKRSEAMDKADDMIKSLSDGGSKKELAKILGKNETFVNALQSEEFRRYSDFDSAELQNMLTDYYYNNETFSTNLEGHSVLFSRVEKAISDLGNVENPKEREAILSCIFTDGCGDSGSLVAGNDQYKLNILSTQGYNVNSAVKASEVVPLSNGKAKIYSPSTGEFIEVTQLTTDPDSNNPVIVSGYALYADASKRLYYSGSGVVGEYALNYANPSEAKINHYDSQNRLWIFTFQKKGVFNNEESGISSEMANYVEVKYDATSQQRTYTIRNVGSDGEIDKNFQGDDKYITSVDSDLLGVKSGKDESTKYDFGKIYNAVNEEYNNRNKERFVADNARAGNYTQSKLLANTVYTPKSECISYMSQSDCDLLFGVCDPVMCPASRFNLNGRWPVTDVVQTGIIGSIVLGLPNFGVKEPLPICLTGIHSGLDNIKTYYEGYEDCLQKAKANGESVGICNTIKSIGMCEILWRESLSIFGSVGSIADLISEKVFGDGKGGGEYLDWKRSWNYLADSVSFFTSSYATSAFASFQARSLGEFGSQICKAAIYGNAPGAGDFIGELLEPSSPYQFTGWFDESDYSAVENGKSVYRVYYHIYAGRDDDAYYYVYLKGTGRNDLIITNVDRGTVGGRGYIAKGNYVDKSGTITTDSGYTQMCINVNGRESCGFGKVSSDFAVNYMNDLLVENELSKTIDSEEECMPDNPTLSTGLGDLTLPSNYGLVETGILRICSAYDPDGDADRWSRVGNCGSEEVGCYVDKTTVSFNDVTKNKAVLAQLNENELNSALSSFNDATKVYLIGEMSSRGEIVKENIKKGDTSALISDLGYYLGIANGASDAEILIESHSMLGDIFVALAKIVKEASDSEMARSIVSGLDTSFKNIQGELIDKDEGIKIKFNYKDGFDSLYKWDGEKWRYTPQFGRDIVLDEEDYLSGLRSIYNSHQSKQDSLVGTNQYLDKVEIECAGKKQTLSYSNEERIGLSFDELSSTISNFCFIKGVEDVTETYRITDVASLIEFVKLSRSISNGVDASGKSCDYSNGAELASWISRYSSTYGVDPVLVLAVAMQENNCRQTGTSVSHAYGFMQITEPTFNETCKDKIDGVNSFDDIQGENNGENNIACGVKILSKYYEIYGSNNRQYKCDAFASNKQVQPSIDKTYSGWQAAVRGYNGWGCSGYLNGREVFADHLYVEKIWNIYNTLNQNRIVGDVDASDSQTDSYCEEIKDLLECRNRDGCYVYDGWNGLFDPDKCMSCQDLEDCGDIKDSSKCGDEVCNLLSGLSCSWDYNSGKCVGP